MQVMWLKRKLFAVIIGNCLNTHLTDKKLCGQINDDFYSPYVSPHKKPVIR